MRRLPAGGGELHRDRGPGGGCACDRPVGCKLLDQLEAKAKARRCGGLGNTDAGVLDRDDDHSRRLLNRDGDGADGVLGVGVDHGVGDGFGERQRHVRAQPVAVHAVALERVDYAPAHDRKGGGVGGEGIFEDDHKGSSKDVCTHPGGRGILAEIVKIRVTRSGSIDLIEVSGEIDLSNVADLDEALTQAFSRDTPCCLLDLSAVSFLDSTVVHLLIRWQADAQLSAREALAVATGKDTPTVRILTLSGVLRHLPLFTTQQAARTALQEGQRARSQRRLRWLTDADLATAPPRHRPRATTPPNASKTSLPRNTAEARPGPTGRRCEPAEGEPPLVSRPAGLVGGLVDRRSGATTEPRGWNLVDQGSRPGCERPVASCYQRNAQAGCLGRSICPEN